MSPPNKVDQGYVGRMATPRQRFETRKHGVVGTAVLMFVAMISGAGNHLHAQTANAPPATQSAPSSNAERLGGSVAGQPAPNVDIVSCSEPSGPETRAHPPVTVTVNKATSWQPRGGVVLVAIEADQREIKGLAVRACFGWSKAAPQAFFTKENLQGFEEAFAALRPSDKPGDHVTSIGVTVPPLRDAPSSVLDRWFSGDRGAGFGIVPVADLRLIGYDENGKLFDVVCPVGITSFGTHSSSRWPPLSPSFRRYAGRSAPPRIPREHTGRQFSTTCVTPSVGAGCCSSFAAPMAVQASPPSRFCCGP